MILPSNRSAVGFAIACGVFLIGLLSVGAAVAHADLVGLGGGGGGGINVLGIDVLGGKANKSGGAASRTTRAVSTAVSTRSVVIRTKPAAAQPESTLTPAVSTASITDVPAVALSAPAVEVMPVAPPPAAPGDAHHRSGGRSPAARSDAGPVDHSAGAEPGFRNGRETITARTLSRLVPGRVSRIPPVGQHR